MIQKYNDKVVKKRYEGSVFMFDENALTLSGQFRKSMKKVFMGATDRGRK